MTLSGKPGADDTGAGPRIKRIYEPNAPDDGVRVLVDRLWPRGISKGRAALDLWLKDVAPSTALREWFGHRPERWTEFQRRYREELRDSAAVEQLREMSRTQRVTLLYAARDEEHNEAAALVDVLLHDSA